MSNRLQKVMLATYVPAVPAVAEVPAHCVTQQVLAGYQSSAPDRQAVPEIGAGIGWSFSPLRPVYRSVTICYPRVPGRPGSPARIDYHANAGWNGGGRSLQQLPENGKFSCSLPQAPVAIVVGLCRRAFDYGYSTMSHAVVIRGSGLTFTEFGKEVGSGVSFVPGARLEIRRERGVVSFWLEEAEVFTSTSASAGETYIGASLYVPGDYLDSPAIEVLPNSATLTESMPALVGLASEGDVSYTGASIPLLVASAVLAPLPGRMHLSAEIPGLLALISETANVSQVKTMTAPLSIIAKIGAAEPILDGLIAVLPPPIFNNLLRSGQTILFSAELPPLIGLAADDDVALVRAELPLSIRLDAWEPYMLAGEIDGVQPVAVVETAIIESALLLMTMDSMSLEDHAEITLILELATSDGATVADQVSFGALVEMIAAEQVMLFADAAAARGQALQYAVNFSTGALTTYRDFEFHGFTNAAGRTYAWRDDGLYRLGDESGEIVRALVDFGATDFDETHGKRLSTAFVGVRSDGEAYLRLSADGACEQVYRLCGGSERRALLAKGVVGRYWNARLELVDASFASIDNLELEVFVSQQRSSKRRCR